MPAPAAYSRRRFVGGAVARNLNADVNNSTLTFVADGALTGWPSGAGDPFLAVINRGQSNEEKFWVDGISGTTITIETGGRGADGTTAASHTAGETIELCIGAQDIDEANYAVSKTVGKVTTIGDLLVADAANSLERLARGTNGFPLVVNTGEALDLAYERLTATGIAASVAGDGLAGGAGTALSVNVDGSTIEISSDTLRVKDAGITAAKLAAAIAGSGLAGGAGSALSVNVDGTGIEIVADTLQLKDSGVVTAKIADAAVTADKIAAAVAGTGLTGGAGTALNVIGGDGITANANDIAVNVDASTIEINSDILRVKDGGITLAKLASAADNSVLEGTGTGVAVTARGRSWADSIAADSSTATNTAAITNLAIAAPALKNGRRYKLELQCAMSVSGAASGIGEIQFRKDGVIHDKYQTTPLTNTTLTPVSAFTYYEPGADETLDWAIYIRSTSAGYDVKIEADTDMRGRFLITDVGKAA